MNENQKPMAANDKGAPSDEEIRQALQEADAMNLKEAGDGGGGGSFEQQAAEEGAGSDPALMQEQQQQQEQQAQQPEQASPTPQQQQEQPEPPLQQPIDPNDPYATYSPDEPAAKDAEEPPAQIQVNVNDNEGILSTLWNNLKEVPQSVAAGVKNGLNEMENTFIASPLKFLEDVRWYGWDKAEFGKDVDQWEQKTINILSPAEYKPQTTGGAIAEGAARFMTAFVPFMGGLGKLGKASEGVRYVSKALSNPYVRASMAGFAADFATLTKQDSHIADLLDKNETFHNMWLVDKLKSKADDTVVEAKLKGAIEGLGLGIATDYVIRTVGRCRRLFKSDGSQQAVEAELRQAQEEQAELMARQDALDANEGLARQQLDESLAREQQGNAAAVAEEEVIDIPDDIAGRRESFNTAGPDAEVFDPETGMVGREADFEDFYSSERNLFDQEGGGGGATATGTASPTTVSAPVSASVETFSPENWRVIKVRPEGATEDLTFFFEKTPDGKWERDDHWFQREDGTFSRRNESDPNYSPSILYDPAKGELHYDINPDHLHSAQELDDLVLDAKTTPDQAVEGIINNPNLRRQVFSDPACPQTILRLGEMMADNLKKNSPEHWNELIQDAESIASRTGNGIGEQVSELYQGTQIMDRLSRINYNCRSLYHVAVSEMNRLGEQVLNGTANSRVYCDYLRMQGNVQRLHEGIANFATSAGRLLASHRIGINDEGAEALSKLFKDKTDPFFGKWEVPPRDMTEAEAERWLKEHGADKERILNCAKQISMSDPGDIAGQVNHIVTVSKGQWASELLKTSYLANLLSSPKTWGINALSNAIKALDRPLSNMLGGIARGNKDALVAGFDELAGMMHQTMASLKMFGKGFKENGSILTGEANQAALLEGKNAHVDAWSGYSLKQQLLAGKPEGTQLTPLQETLVTAFDYIGKSVNLPFRVLAGTDEVFKQLSFRAGAFSRLCAEARETGVKNVYEYAEQNLQKYIDAEGKMVADAKGADVLLQQAKEATFTQSLGKTGASLQNIANSSPLMKVVLPFVRTPMNIMKDVFNHTPLGMAGKMFSSEYRQRFYTDKAFQAQECGKVAVGTLTCGLAALLNQAGIITGSAPANPKVANYWKDSGFQPFSVKVGGKWVSYGRLDPFGMLLGLTVDTMEVMKTYPFLTNEEQEKMWGHLFAAHISNVTNKTYMQGLSQFLNFVTQADKRFDRYAGSIASNLVPASAAMREARKLMNPEMKELDDWLSYVRNSIPYQADSLATRMNWVTGNPDEYANFPNARMDDKVMNELYRLADGIIGVPTKYVKGIRLDAEQYARFKELHATVKIGGLTMYQTLDRLFDKPEYDISRNRLGDAMYGESGPREKAVNRIINAYRDLAVHELRKEFGQLDKAVFKSELMSAGAKAGVSQQSGGESQIEGLMRQYAPQDRQERWERYREDLGRLAQ